MAVGLVETEHESAGDAVALLDPDELVEVADHAVDVVAEVHVRVEDLGALGQLRAHVRLEALEQRLRPGNDVGHPEPESTEAGESLGSTGATRAHPVRGKGHSHLLVRTPFD